MTGPEQPPPQPAGGRQPPLDGLQVVDLTTELGTLACRFLTGLGAHVTRVEPPGGDPLRAKPPLARGAEGRPLSLFWLHLMQGRRCVRLDLADEQGRDELLGLLEGADVLIESQPVGLLEELGLGHERLQAEFPRLIWTSITPFGREGPRAGWAATDLIGLAAGGLMSICGDPDRAPLRPSVEQAYVQAASAAVAGTLAAVHARHVTGKGQLVDVSMQEAVSNCLGNTRLFYALDGVVSRRAGGGRAYGRHGSRLIYACRDGFIAISRTPNTMGALHGWLQESGMEPRFDPAEWALLPMSGTKVPEPAKTKELDEDLAAFFARGKKGELYEEGQRRGLMICPVSTPADLLASEQLRARGFFRERFSPELGRTIRVPGPPVRMSATPWREDPPPPPTPPAARRIQPAMRDGDAGRASARSILAGIRVADFSWVGVGPLATQLLAALGAEVIRVESTARLDILRSSGPQRGESPADASAYFANFNRDKLGITLNLKRPRAREVALRLVERSAILVESFRPGFMASVGLSYDDVKAVNPSIIMISCSMEGATGPHAHFKGFGLTLQALAGITHFTGWPDRPPVGTGTAYTDWVATHTAAIALLAALEHRRRTGEGQYIDLSQLEANIWALDTEVLRYTVNGEMRPPLGNRHEEMTPHGVFPCRGEDRWIAIAVRDARDWQALAELLPDERWGSPDLRDREARRAIEDEIEQAIGAWTAGQDGEALAALLQSRGVPAYPVNDVAGVHLDPQLRSRGHFWPLRHPTIGEVEFDAPAFRLSDTPLSPGKPAPTLGQDNEHVYREILGYSEEELAGLIAAGVLE